MLAVEVIVEDDTEECLNLGRSCYEGGRDLLSEAMATEADLVFSVRDEADSHVG